MYDRKSTRSFGAFPNVTRRTPRRFFQSSSHPTCLAGVSFLDASADGLLGTESPLLPTDAKRQHEAGPSDDRCRCPPRIRTSLYWLTESIIASIIIVVSNSGVFSILVRRSRNNANKISQSWLCEMPEQSWSLMPASESPSD